MSIDTLNSKILKLTNCQKRVNNYMIKHHRNENFCAVPMRIFINGSGGVGKSFLTKLIREWLKMCTSQILGCDPVMLCAPTGTTARNING